LGLSVILKVYCKSFEFENNGNSSLTKKNDFEHAQQVKYWKNWKYHSSTLIAEKTLEFIKIFIAFVIFPYQLVVQISVNFEKFS